MSYTLCAYGTTLLRQSPDELNSSVLPLITARTHFELWCIRKQTPLLKNKHLQNAAVPRTVSRSPVCGLLMMHLTMHLVLQRDKLHFLRKPEPTRGLGKHSIQQVIKY